MRRVTGNLAPAATTSDSGGTAPAASNGAGAGTGGFGGPMATREEAYRQLAKVADVLEHLEPHSPIPDLLRRAIQLGRMPFRELVRELVREPTMLTEIRREFGIKEPESS
jgi:type VI secretion system protein ImpA